MSEAHVEVARLLVAAGAKTDETHLRDFHAEVARSPHSRRAETRLLRLLQGQLTD
jgi:hypothetical protein